MAKLKLKFNDFLPLIKNIAIILSLILAIISCLIILFELIFIDKFFPRVFIGDTHLMLLSKVDAQKVLQSKFNHRTKQKLQFTYNNQSHTINLTTASVKINYNQTLENAYSIGRSRKGNLPEIFTQQLRVIFFGLHLTPEMELTLDPQTDQIEKIIYKSPKNASLLFNEAPDATSSARIQVEEGKNGLELDKEVLQKVVFAFIVAGQKPEELPVKSIDPEITTQDVTLAKQFLEGLGKESIKLEFNSQTWTLDAKTLITLLDLKAKDGQIIDSNKLTEFIKDIASNIDQPIVEAQFNFNESTRRVTEFKPAQEGRVLNQPKTVTLILLALKQERSKIISLPVEVTQPKIKNEQVNNLGINELIGQGISHFAGSIPNRIYNLSLAASRINGILIAPGEVFSFNDRVGDISAASGYKPAYVIKSGRTVLDDGGGVCQDSTTLFRAVLNAGLPVIARTAHAYRVGYYEQGFPPGLDATVFAPSVDFKFKNDTPSHILIQAYVSGNTLYVDIYGSNNGRISTISTPKISNQTPPPPEIRQDDPELPKGAIKQVDWSAWGANVSFVRTVKKGGETIINETFRSNYKPWAAVYLVGTKE